MNKYQILLTVNVESDVPVALAYAASTLAETMEGFEFDADSTDENESTSFNNVARITSVRVDSTVVGPGSILRDA